MKRLIEQYKSLSIRLATLLLLLVCLRGTSVLAQQNSKIFLVKSKDISSYNQAIEGFRKQSSPERTIVEYDLGGTLKNTDKLIKKLQQEKPDLVVAVGAKAMLALTQSKISQPMVFCMVMNPEDYQLEDCNATGVSLDISPEEQIKVLTALNPKIKKVGVLSRKHASPELLDNVTKLAWKYRLDVVPIEFESEKKIPRKLRPALDKVDALWMLDDSFIHSKETLEFIILNSIENNLPFMAISKVFVKEGALVSLSPSFSSNGQQAAQIAEKVFRKEIKPKNIPVSFHKNPDLVLNLKIARKIGLTIPTELVNEAKELYE